MESFHLGLRWPCHLCDVQLTTPSRLKSHRRVVHRVYDDLPIPEPKQGGEPTSKFPERIPSTKCLFCGEEHHGGKAMRDHVRQRHPDQDPNTCEICGKKFPYYRRLYVHKVNVHFPQEERQCGQCGTSFLGDLKLARHIEQAHGNGHSAEEQGFQIAPLPEQTLQDVEEVEQQPPFVGEV